MLIHIVIMGIFAANIIMIVTANEHDGGCAGYMGSAYDDSYCGYDSYV